MRRSEGDGASSVVSLTKSPSARIATLRPPSAEDKSKRNCCERERRKERNDASDGHASENEWVNAKERVVGSFIIVLYN